MKQIGLTICYFLMAWTLPAQSDSQGIIAISREDLAGENLRPAMQPGETDTSYYQQKAYDGTDFVIYLVAIKNRTNEFQRFPIEEFIYWADGKAIVEPAEDEPFAVQAGDYFIQPKGFQGKFNFVSGDEPHLELALISKKRADSASVSPMTKAMIIEPNILSGSSEAHAGEEAVIYSGVELHVNLVRHRERSFAGNGKERLIHLLSGTLTMESGGAEERFYPGDFFVIPQGFSGQWKSDSFRTLRAIEVMQINQ